MHTSTINEMNQENGTWVTRMPAIWDNKIQNLTDIINSKVVKTRSTLYEWKTKIKTRNRCKKNRYLRFEYRMRIPIFLDVKLLSNNGKLLEFQLD